MPPTQPEPAGPTILGVDPGFANTGWAVISCETGTAIRTGVISTKKFVQRVKVGTADDTYRRAQEIYGQLRNLWECYAPRIVVAEAMSYPRNATSAAKVAMTWGVLASCCMQYDTPLVQVSPQQIKLLLCGSTSAQKQDVAIAVGAEGLSEHEADAIGAVRACWTYPLVIAARKFQVGR